MTALDRRAWMVGAVACAAAGLGGRLMPASAQGTAAPSAGGIPRAPLHRLHTGDLGALVAVDATLGGRPWRCLVDTGATVALVSPAVAARERLEVLSRSRVATAGGTMTVERVALPPVEVAGRRLAAPHALVLDLAAQLGEVGAGIDGLIGAPALRGAVVRLDLAGGWLGLGAAPAPDGPAAGAVWPLRWDAGLPVVDLALGDRPPAPFLFDTGNAGALVVFAHHAAALVGDPSTLPRVTMRELGGDVTVHQALIARCSAPGWVGRDLPAVFEAGTGARRGGHFDRVAGSAGLALFGAGAVTLDGPGAQLRVELPGLPEPPPLPGGFGFALSGVAGQTPEVSAVFDGGPAMRAGVRPGQRLRAIDGRDLTGIGAGAVWRMLAGAAQARFTFGDDQPPVALARERFFPRWP